MNYLTEDTEFSSFYSADRMKSGELLQVAIVPVIDGVADKSRAFNEYCRPLTKIWNSHSEKVHGISRKRAESFQHPSELCEKLGKWIEQFDDVFMMMGYNCTGDKRFIERLVVDYGISNDWHFKVQHKWKDVHDMAKKRKKQIPKKSLSLSSLCEYFGIETKSHDALYDAIATFEVSERLKLMDSPTEARQNFLVSQMTEVEKRKKYLDLKYMMINGEGSIFITEHATKDKEALRIILGEIWSLYVDNKE